MESLEFSNSETDVIPEPERVYLHKIAAAEGAKSSEMQLLHPLLIFDADCEEVFFLSGRQGKRQAEYLCYNSSDSHCSGRLIEFGRT